MIDTNNIEKAKKMIKDGKDRPIIVAAQDDAFNRKMIEYGKFDIILGIEKMSGKNSLRHVDSGFNHVLARTAAKNEIAIGIDLDYIRTLNNKDMSIIFEKIRQNIKICRKSEVKIKLINYKDKRDSSALLLSLGASSKQAKEATESISF